jgi:hypothetical protein
VAGLPGLDGAGRGAAPDAIGTGPTDRQPLRDQKLLQPSHGRTTGTGFEQALASGDTFEHMIA